VIRKTLDAQYRYTVGLAPLYRAPRKYCSMKKCCCPCVSPCLVPFHPSIPSRLVSRRLSIARARSSSSSFLCSVRRNKMYQNESDTTSEINNVVFFSFSHSSVASLSLSPSPFDLCATLFWVNVLARENHEIEGKIIASHLSPVFQAPIFLDRSAIIFATALNFRRRRDCNRISRRRDGRYAGIAAVD